MATAKGIAKMSKIFDQAYEKPIDEEAYSLWLELFEGVDDKDLRRVAIRLVETRAQYMRGLVTPDEITRELQDMGIHIHHRREDPAIVNDLERLYGDGIAMAAYRQIDKEGGQAIDSYRRGNNGTPDKR